VPVQWHCDLDEDVSKWVLKTTDHCHGREQHTKVVEPVHAPQHGHDPSIELLDKRNLSGISLLVSTRVIHLANNRHRLPELVVSSLRLLEHDDLIVFLILEHGGWSSRKLYAKIRVVCIKGVGKNARWITKAQAG
jgi:hypothetical protein